MQPDNAEQHRHESEVRHYLALVRKRGTGWFKGYVIGWKRWPGSKLQRDFWEQQRKGNTGKPGEWL